MGTYICSDIHGNYKGLLEVLSIVGFKNTDRLIIAGDLIDRGKDSDKLIELVLSNPNIELLMGNHELMFMRSFERFPELYIGKVYSSKSHKYHECRLHYINGGKQTMKSLSRYYKNNTRDLSTEFFNYLNNSNLYSCINNIFISHTGLYDKNKLEESLWDIGFWLSSISNKNKILSSSIIGHFSNGSSYNDINNPKLRLDFLAENEDKFILNLDGSDNDIIPLFNIDNFNLYFKSCKDLDKYNVLNIRTKKFLKISIK